MPTVYRERGYRFFFWSNERNEPPHVHVESGDGYAKFWLAPVAVAESLRFDASEIRELLRIVSEQREMFESVCMDTSAHSFGPALSTRAVTVEVTSDYLNVQLEDGRRVSAPVVWFPKLVGATADQRSRWRLIGGGVGITWPELDEDISVEGLLAVRGELLTAPTPSGITTGP